MWTLVERLCLQESISNLCKICRLRRDVLHLPVFSIRRKFTRTYNIRVCWVFEFSLCFPFFFFFFFTCISLSLICLSSISRISFPYYYFSIKLLPFVRCLVCISSWEYYDEAFCLRIDYILYLWYSVHMLILCDYSIGTSAIILKVVSCIIHVGVCKCMSVSVRVYLCVFFSCVQTISITDSV